jgi:hypothetical protein
MWLWIIISAMYVPALPVVRHQHKKRPELTAALVMQCAWTLWQVDSCLNFATWLVSVKFVEKSAKFNPKIWI